MGKSSVNLQDSFLNQARREGRPLTVVLTGGAELKGRVLGFDNFTLAIHTGEHKRLIYKHAVAQLITSHSDREDGGRERPRRDAGPKTGPKQSDEHDGGFNPLDLTDVQDDVTRES